MGKDRSWMWFGATLAIVVLAGWSCANERTQSLNSVPSPAGPGSSDGSLTVGADGQLYLSWIEPEDAGYVFQFSRWEGNEWSAPRVIARGDDWVVNGADVPALTVLADGRTLMAHWLARSGTGAEASGIRVVRSRDGGTTWSVPLTPHRDSTETEHGFLSWNPLGNELAALVWLDGRETRTGGAMTLRFATLNAEGALADEAIIDSCVCDCCPTDLVSEDSLLFVVYRDRSEEEIRDIRMARYDGKAWSEGRLVHPDGWKIAGCPVNGPAVAARDKIVGVAWFTVDPADHGHVRLAVSQDAGDTFQDPLEITETDPLGRVGLVMTSDGAAWVLWLEAENDGKAEVRLRKRDAAGNLGESILVARTSASPTSGVPRLASIGNDLFVAWTSVVDEKGPGTTTRVLTARVR